MNDRSLIATGGVAAVLAAVCCATPLLAILLGGIGLTALDSQSRLRRPAGAARGARTRRRGSISP